MISPRSELMMKVGAVLRLLNTVPDETFMQLLRSTLPEGAGDDLISYADIPRATVGVSSRIALMRAVEQLEKRDLLEKEAGLVSSIRKRIEGNYEITPKQLAWFKAICVKNQVKITKDLKDE